MIHIQIRLKLSCKRKVVEQVDTPISLSAQHERLRGMLWDIA